MIIDEYYIHAVQEVKICVPLQAENVISDQATLKVYFPIINLWIIYTLLPLSLSKLTLY